MKKLSVKKFKRQLLFVIFIITILVVGFSYTYLSAKFDKKTDFNQISKSDQGKEPRNEWFFLPKYCFENNCLTFNDKTNEMSINFPNSAIAKEFEPQERCTEENCITVTSSKTLFDFYGVTNFKGYYKRDIDISVGSGFEVGAKQCDKFVIQEGNKTIANFLQFYARRHKDNVEENTNPPINIDISLLSEEQKKLLINSDQEHPVKIYIHKSYVPSQGIGPCYSFVKILGVKKSE